MSSLARVTTQATGAGQGALPDSAPKQRGTALQYPNNAKKVQPKKKKHTDSRQKQTCSPQKRSADALSTIFSWSSTHRRIADILSFPPRARPPLNYYPITFIRSLGAKKKKRVLQGTVVLHMQYPARVTTFCLYLPYSNC